MSIRQKILAALSRGGKTADDLLDIMPDEPRKRLVDNVSQAVKEGLVSRNKDDATGMPLYSITASGKERLEAGVGAMVGRKRKSVVDIPKENGSQTHQKYPLPAIEEDDILTQDDPVLLASANRARQAMQNEIFKALCVSSHEEAIQAIDVLHNIEKERDEWKSFANICGCNTPEELRQYINDILKERRVQPGISPEYTAKAHGYAVMLMDGVEIYDSVPDASESAMRSLRHDQGIGYKIAVVEVVKIAENTVVQRWLEAA